MLSPTEAANPFADGTYANKIREAEIALSRLAEAGKGLGDPAYDEAYRNLALIKEEARQYAAELAKTPAQIQREADALAAKEAKAEEARRRNEARVNVELQKIEELQAKEVQAAMESDRLKAIGENAEISNQHIVDLNNELEELRVRQADLGKAGVGVGYTEYDQNNVRIAEIQQELMDYQASLRNAENETMRFSDRIKKAFSGIPGLIKNTGTAMLGFHRNTKKSNASLGTSLKTVLKYTLGIRSLYVLFNRLRSAVKEGFKNLAQYSGETNKSVSMLMSSLTRLKNSLATAFAPILNVVAPTLTSFINLISEITTKIGMLIAALTGRSTFTKAVTVQQDYAASLGGTAKNAEKAEKALEGYLSPIDEINKMDKPNEDAASNGGGGGGGISPQNMFKEVTIPNKFKEFADRLRAAFEAGDWKRLGTLLGEKVNEAIDSVDWSGIGNKLGYWINAGLQTTYWFLDTVNFTNIGKRISELLNGALEKIDFTYVGRLIAKKITIILDLIIGFLTGLDWGLVAKSLSDIVTGFFDELTKFLTKYDWSQLGNTLWQKIKDFFANIDYAGLAESFFTFLGSAISSAAQFLGGFFGGIAEDIKKWWDEDIAGADWTETADNLLSAIAKGFTNLASWVEEHIIDPFCNALLGEDAWADIKQAGENIVDGLFQGISEFFADPLGKVKESLVDPFINAFKELFGISSPSTVMAEQAQYIMEGMFNEIEKWLPDIQGLWEKMRDNASEISSSIKDHFVNSFEDIKSSAIDIFEKVKSKISDLWSAVKEKASSIGSTISNAFSSISYEQNLRTPIAPVLPIPNIPTRQIPYLATGAVIPPNAPFAAVLGDQRRGNNIEAPESLIRKIVREETGRGSNGISGTIRIPIILDGRQIFEAVLDEARLRQMANGKNAFEF